MPETFTEAGFGPLTTSFDLDEGEGDEYTIALLSAPTSPVTVTMSADPVSPVTVTPSVIFTPTDWATPQTVTLFAADDFVDRTYPTVTISHTVSGASEYASLSLPDVTVAVSDNDDAAVVIAGDPIEIVEGLSGSYQVSLSSEPLAAVTVTTSSSSPQVLEVVGSPLVFLPESWFTPQDVTARAIDDFEAGNGSATLSHVVTSSDGLYDGFDLPDVAVTIFDNDVVSPLVSLVALNTGAGIRLMWELPSPLDPAATVTLRYAPDSPPLSPAEGTAVENGTGGVFALSDTWFIHSPPAADTLYYSAFVAADDVTSPRVSAVVYPVTLSVLQSGAETRIQVTDRPGIDQVNATVRRGGAATFEVEPVPLSPSAGVWSALLPTAFVNDIRGLEFFVVLSGIDLDDDNPGGERRIPRANRQHRLTARRTGPGRGALPHGVGTGNRRGRRGRRGCARRRVREGVGGDVEAPSMERHELRRVLRGHAAGFRRRRGVLAHHPHQRNLGLRGGHHELARVRRILRRGPGAGVEHGGKPRGVHDLARSRRGPGA